VGIYIANYNATTARSIIGYGGLKGMVSLEMSNRILFFMFGAATFLAGWLFGFTFDHVTNWIGWLIP